MLARPHRLDDTGGIYFGKQENRKPSKQRGDRPFTKGGKVGVGGKRAIVSLVERGGRVRSFHVENADKATVNIIVGQNLARESRLPPTRVASTTTLWNMLPST